MAHRALSELDRLAREARAAAEDFGGRAAGDLRERGEDARAQLARLWGQIEDLFDRRVAPAASRTAASAEGYAREARDRAAELAEGLRAATRARPLLAIGIAVAATYAVATLLGGAGRRRR
jgi:hypothetical protein